MAEDPITTAAPAIAEVDKAANAAPVTVASGPEAGAATAPADKMDVTIEAPSTDINGHADEAKPNGDAAEAAPESADVTMHDADESIADATQAKPATPTSTKKSVNGSKKKTSGVPEHKNKKLNRKKSKPVLHLDAKPGELYLARMKGHQPWPSIVCDEEMLPQVLLNSRPVSTAQPDGTFKREEYASGGKREHERTFPVMFLFTNEFAWILNTDLTPATPDECAEAAAKTKAKNLGEAYKVAAEGHDLAYFKGLLKDHEEYLEAEATERAEREAKKAAKEKRKSDAAAAAAEKMDVDDEKPKSKKRKKDAGNEEDGKPPKQAKSEGVKLKLTTPKTPKEAAPKKPSKVKATTKKSSKTEGSDEDESPKATEKPLTPAEAMEKKEKEVRYIRHKLQKGFLGGDRPPADDELKQMSSFLEKVEGYSEIEGAILRATKIHKVLKAMIKLDSIPMDETYQFTSRSQKLLSRWNKVLADDTATAEKEGEKKTEGGTGDEKDGEKPAENAKPAEEAKPDTNAAGSADASKPEPAAGKPAAPEKPAGEAKPEEANPVEPAVDKPAVPEPAVETAEAAA